MNSIYSTTQKVRPAIFTYAGCVWTINEPHLPYKTGLDVMQSHPLRRTRFSQYRAPSAALGWAGDGDCYNIMYVKARNSYTQISETSTYWGPHIHTDDCLVCRKLKTTYSWTERMEKLVLLFWSHSKGKCVHAVDTRPFLSSQAAWVRGYIHQKQHDMYTNRQWEDRWAASLTSEKI